MTCHPHPSCDMIKSFNRAHEGVYNWTNSYAEIFAGNEQQFQLEEWKSLTKALNNGVLEEQGSKMHGTYKQTSREVKRNAEAERGH